MDAVLGNHDYTGNALAQLDPAIRNVDSRYTVLAKSFIVNSGNQIKYSIRPKKNTCILRISPQMEIKWPQLLPQFY
jgi:hypothetical protein